MKKVLFGMMVWQVEVLLSVTFTGDAFAEKTAFVTVRPTLCWPAPEKVGVMLCVLAAMGEVAVKVHGGALFVQPPLIAGCGTLNGNVNASAVSMPAQEPGSGVSDLSTKCTR